MKTIQWLFMSFVVMVLLAIGGSPYWTLHQLNTAYQNKDASTINAHIEFGAVRQSLKNQLQPILTQKAQTLTDSPLLSAIKLPIDMSAVIEQILDYAINHAITPDGINTIIQNPKQVNSEVKVLSGLILIALDGIDIKTLLSINNPDALEKALKQQLNIAKTAVAQDTTASYCGINCFVVHTQLEGYPLTIHFQRSGLLDWKIIAIQLPVGTHS